ncbi:MAG: zinc ribbon domain-containing protein [Candidatus Hydrogenedentales bacterium]|jgi:putative FmdB family regulatory protein
MPLFGYVCEKCHAESEILIRGSETPTCPSCGSEKLVKQLSAFAPMSGSSAASAPTPCGASSCCQMSGGGCPYN